MSDVDTEIERIVKSAIYQRQGNKPETWCFDHAARLGYAAGLRAAAEKCDNLSAHKTGTYREALDKIYEAGGYGWDEVKDVDSAIMELRGE